MKKTMVSYRLYEKTLDQIKWLAEYLSERDADNYTNTDIIAIAIQEYFWNMQMQSIEGEKEKIYWEEQMNMRKEMFDPKIPF